MSAFRFDVDIISASLKSLLQEVEHADRWEWGCCGDAPSPTSSSTSFGSFSSPRSFGSGFGRGQSSTFCQPIAMQYPPLSPHQPRHAVDDGFSKEEIESFQRLLGPPNHQPPRSYRCHICNKGDHFIADCPQRMMSNDELTPYQGRRQCYGEFTCVKCHRRWSSLSSGANEGQACIKCKILIFPHKQLPLEKAAERGLCSAKKLVDNMHPRPVGHGRRPSR